MSAEEKVKRLAAFCVLMENNDGIVGKSPSYILEKYATAMSLPVHLLHQMHDDQNQRKYFKYLKTWKI